MAALSSLVSTQIRWSSSNPLDGRPWPPPRRLRVSRGSPGRNPRRRHPRSVSLSPGRSRGCPGGSPGSWPGPPDRDRPARPTTQQRTADRTSDGPPIGRGATQDRSPGRTPCRQSGRTLHPLSGAALLRSWRRRGTPPAPRRKYSPPAEATSVRTIESSYPPRAAGSLRRTGRRSAGWSRRTPGRRNPRRSARALPRTEWG